MKKIIIMAAAAAMLTACNSQSGGNTYQIEGEATHLNNGQKLLLDDNTGHTIDTIVINDGKFAYTGQADTIALYSLWLMDDNTNGVNFFSEPGNITITLLAEASQNRVGGTPSNNALQQLIDETAPFYQQMSDIEQGMNNGTDEWALAERYKQLINEVNKKYIEMAQQNTDNEIGFMLVTSLIDEELYADTLKQLIAQMPQEYRQRQPVNDLLKRMKAKDAVQVGNKMEDFSLNTPEGTPQNIMELVGKNKLTILDFWASWCGPCRREMPFMKQLYEQYQHKGLGIVGISLDDKGDAWQQAINDLGIPWPQLSDLNGWNCSAAQLFQVNSIPYIVILNQQGIILQKALRGEELKQFISSQLD